ncbi:unnamed protein product [Prorocentrum cordatum]|uniref:PIPK domain-containing protein n=1 Tax=Prorocentrum cordatum TaxID=2364126 RepID=A0ABN9TEP9_9DINO|nr:unnamed protein product [Polarella glacialis]
MFDGATATEIARHVAMLIQSMAGSLSTSELLSGGGTRGPHRLHGEFMDARSGAMSPFVVNPALAKQVLAEVARSFESAMLREDDDASRSGALFVVSGDGLFLGKTVRESEYQEFARHVIGPLARHAGLPHAVCRPGSLDSCWAEAALNRTSLNVPVLAFVHGHRHWIVMPASARMRGFAVSRSAQDLEPLGTAQYYDVKPIWAKSKARQGFLRQLAVLGMNPAAAPAIAEMQAQWVELKATVGGDVDFLSREGSDERPFIDYSLLFEIYAPGRRVDVRGAHCLEARSCFEEDPTGCRVLCVSIIDFFTRFSVYRHLESLWKKFKFHDYGQKVKDLLGCPLRQRPLSPRWHAGARAVLRVNGTEHFPPLPFSRAVEVEIHLQYKEKESYLDEACEPYLDMVCEDVVSEINWTTDVEQVEDECKGPYSRSISCKQAQCVFLTESRYLDQCGSWMQQSCHKKLLVVAVLENVFGV